MNAGFAESGASGPTRSSFSAEVASWDMAASAFDVAALPAYFDAVQTAISAGAHSTGAMAGSTEAEQFNTAVKSGPARVVA